MNDRNMTRRPSSPGEILKGLYMEPLSLTVVGLAETLGVSRKALSSLINGHSSVSVDMALRLSRAFGTTPNVWLNLQQGLDLWEAEHSTGAWRNVPPVYTPSSDEGERVT